MLIHDCVIRDRTITASPRLIVQNGVNSDALRLTPDEEYSHGTVTLVIARDGRSTAIPWLGTPIPVPGDMLQEPGEIRLTAICRPDDGTRIVTRRMETPLLVVRSGDLTGSYESGDPALDEVEQAVADAREATRAALDAAARCNTIILTDGRPAAGGKANDLAISASDGTLWRYEETEMNR